jgi:hypothetical protein
MLPAGTDLATPGSHRAASEAMFPRMTRLRLLPLLLALACAGGRSDDASPDPAAGPATLEVENQNFLDMTVYVVDGGVRQRIGVAPGNATTSLTISERLIRGGASPLRFLCDPIGSGGPPVSEEIVVVPGDVVELVIPPR